MSYKNFSNKYKEVLLNAEENVKKLWFKNLWVEDIFLEVVKQAKWNLKEILNLFWINEKLVLEIIQKGTFNEIPETRKWVYTWMSSRTKNIILWSIKIAANNTKTKAIL